MRRLLDPQPLAHPNSIRWASVLLTAVVVWLAPWGTAQAQTLSINSPSVTEPDSGTALLTYTVSLSAPTGQTVTVNYADAGTGTATGSDYQALAAGTLTFDHALGETSKTITVTVLGDELDEWDETIEVTLSDPNNATITTATGTGTITDNDPEQQLRIQTTSLNEGDSTRGSYIAILTVFLKPSGKTMQVSYADTGTGTATSGDDYEAIPNGTLTFAPGEVSQHFLLTVLGDTTPEFSETIIMELSDPINATIPNPTATITLRQDDIPRIDIADASANEGGSVTFSVTISASPIRDAIVDYATSIAADDTAEAADFTTTSGTFTFAANTTTLTQTFTVPTEKNTLVEGRETFTATLTHVSNPWNGLIRKATAKGTIIDDIGIAGASADEGDSVTFTVTLSASPEATMAVDYATSIAAGDTAAALDFTTTSGTLNFTATTLTQTFTVPTTNDNVVEGNETFTATLSQPTNADFPTATAKGTIRNDDSAAVTVNDASAAEGDNLTFTVTLDTAVQGGLTVTPTYTNVSTSNSDYTANTGALTFAGTANEMQTFTVATIEDAVVEGDERFTVGLTVSGTTVSVTASDTGTGMITNDDSVVVALAVTPETVAEDAGATTVTVTATLDPTTVTFPEDTEVTVSVAGSGASNAVDFTAVSDFGLTIGAGQTSGTGTFTLTPSNDGVHEANETITVAGTVPGGQTVNAATLTLTDDEALPTVTLRVWPTPISENSASSGVSAELSGRSSQQIVVTLTATAQSPAVSSDFTMTYGTTLIIEANTLWSSTSKTITPVDNDVDAPDKSVIVSATVSGGNGVEAPLSQTLTITDDDTATIDLSVTPGTVAEDAGATTVTVTATLDPTTVTLPADTAVTVSVAGSGANNAVDFTAVSDFTLTFGAGETSSTGTFTLSPINDSVDEVNETITVRGTVPGGQTVNAATLTLTDDDASPPPPPTPTPPTVTLEVSPASISENSGVSTVTATLSESTSQATTVTVSAAAQSPAVSGDFTLSTNKTLTIAANALTSTGTVTITGVNNDVDAADKSVKVRGTASGGLTVNEATLTITDDDTAAVMVSKTNVTVTEASGAGQTATYTVKLGSQPTGVVTVTPASDATGVATVSPTTLTFTTSNWSATQTVTVTGVDDAIDNAADRTATVTHTVAGGGYGSVSAASVAVTLTDDDDAPTVTLEVSPASISENSGVSTVTATLSESTSQATTVTVSATAQSPAVSGDFTLSTNETLTIAANALTSTGTVTITGVNNDVDAADKSVKVRGTASGGLTVNEATLTITDDDTAAVMVSKTNVTVTEASGAGQTATYTVKLGSQPTGVVTVTPASDATGVATVSPTTLTFTTSNWSATQTVTVTGVDDAIDNAADRTATVTHTVAGGGYGSVSAASVAVTLTDDDDAPTVTLEVSPASISENSGVSTVTATLSESTSQATTVTVSATAQSPAVSGDFTLSTNETLTIAANALTSTGTVTITGVNNDVDAADKSVKVRGTASGGLTVNEATLTITDDDTAAVMVSKTNVTVTEASGAGQTATYTVKLGSQPTGVVTVTPASDATGVATVSPTTLTFTTSNWSATQTVTVTGVDDAIDNAADRTATVTHTVAGGGYGSVSAASVAVTLTDDDDAPTVTLEVSPASISENSGVSTVTATLSESTSQATTVTVSATAQSPAVSGDFTLSTNETLTIDAGATTSTGTVTITGVDNDVDAADKSVKVRGTASGGLTVNEATLTITDDDTAAVMVSETNVTVTEASGAGQTATYTVKLGSQPTGVVTVTPASDATGVATVSPTTLTFTTSNWSATQTVTVTGVDDAIDNAADRTATVTHTVAGGGYGSVSAASVAVTLTDDDDAPTVTLEVSPASISENNGVSTVTATLSESTSQATTVTVSAAAQSPAVSGDFTLSTNETLTIAANALTSTGTVTITGVNNDVDAADKSVKVRGTASGGLTVNEATLTITDDDTAAVMVSKTNVTVTEASGAGQTATYTVKLGSQPTGVVTVTPASDATGVATVSPTTLTFTTSNWSATQTVTVTGVDDAIDNAADRTATVTHTVAGGGYGSVSAASVAVTLTDDDDAPTVTLEVSPASISENSGVSTVTATLSESTSQATTVTVSATAQSPAVSGDFTLSTNETLTIAANALTSTGTVTITGVNNDVDAADKSVKVRGTASGGLTVNEATLTITDDDTAAVMVSKTNVTVTEASGAGQTATYTVKLGSQPTGVVTVTPASDATGVATVSPTTLTFTTSNWSATQTVTVTGVDDAIDNAADRTATVTHTVAGGGYGSVSAASVAVTLTDDDDAPTVTLEVSPASISENSGVSTVTATLSESTSQATTVTVSATAQSPAVSGDFTLSTNKTLTIAANALTSTGTVTITGVNNDVDAADKSVTVSATVSGGNGVGAPTSQTLTITDDDVAPTGVALAVSPASVGENAGTTLVTVTATVEGGTTFSQARAVTVEGGTTFSQARAVTVGGRMTFSQAQVVTVRVGALHDAATEGTDYATVADWTLTIGAGQTSGTGTFTLTPLQDEVDEGTGEAVSVSGTLSGVTVTGTTLTIMDDEAASTGVALAVSPASVAEDGGAQSVRVTAAFPQGSAYRFTDTIVTLSVAGKTASAEDFAAVADFPVIIPRLALRGTATFTLTPILDVLMEGDETVTVSGIAAGLTVTGTEVTIVDDVRGAKKVGTAVNRAILPPVTQAMAADTETAVKRRIDAVTSGVGQVPAYNVASQRTLAGLMQTVSDGLRDGGSLTVERLLGGTSFVLPLNTTDDGSKTGWRSLAIWGTGDYRNLGGGEAVDWDGEIFSGHLGVDTRLSADLLVGLATSVSQGSLDYAGLSGANPIGGSYTTRMTSVHPYVNWSSSEGLDLWGTLGYGWGEIAIAEQGALQRKSSDTTMQTATVGANGRLLSVAGLLPGGTTRLRLKAEALLTNIKVEGNGGAIEPVALDARRFRLALEGSHERPLASGARLVPTVELGVRHDGGDGIEGTGLEVGGGLRYVDQTSGLTVAGRGRALVTYGAQEYREWGANLFIQMDPGTDGQGLSFTLLPTYGQTASGVSRLWEQGGNGVGTARQDALGRLEALVGYGLPTLEGKGLLTPYSAVTLESTGHQLRLGGLLGIGSSFNVSLEGTREVRRETPTIYGVRLQANRRF